MNGDSPTPPSLFFAGEARSFRALSTRLFGRPLRKNELRGLSGAPGGARIDVGVLEEMIYIEYQEFDRIGMSGVCRVGLESADRVLWNDSTLIFRQEYRSRGIGLECFARQVFWSRQLGILWAKTVGGRCDGENGYYSWPRYGFDAALPRTFRLRLSRHFGKIVSVLDLMETDLGRRYWREHGFELALSFDFSPRSRSMVALDRYMHEKRSSPASFFYGRGPEKISAATAGDSSSSPS